MVRSTVQSYTNIDIYHIYPSIEGQLSKTSTHKATNQDIHSQNRPSEQKTKTDRLTFPGGTPRTLINTFCHHSSSSSSLSKYQQQQATNNYSGKFVYSRKFGGRQIQCRVLIPVQFLVQFSLSWRDLFSSFSSWIYLSFLI